MSSFDIFAVANGVDFEDYLTNHYSIEFKAHKCRCPIHGDKDFAFKVYANGNGKYKDNTAKCHGCGWQGSLVDFVCAHDNVVPLEAAESICQNSGIEVPKGSKPPKADKTATAQKPKKERPAFVPKDFSKEFAAFHKELRDNLEDIYPHLQALFVKPSAIIENESLFGTLGYDPKEGSIVIGIADADGRIVNIKHHHKHKSDGSLFEGKWIGMSGGSGFLFPFEAWWRSESSELFVGEGEKDALNSYSLGIPHNTLGGVSSLWGDYMQYLSGVTEITIMTDHDRAGYENAYKRVEEFYKHFPHAKIYVLDWTDLVQSPTLGYDATDYYKHLKSTDGEYVKQKIKEARRLIRLADKKQDECYYHRIGLMSLAAANALSSKSKIAFHEWLSLISQNTDPVRTAIEKEFLQNKQLAKLSLMEHVDELKKTIGMDETKTLRRKLLSALDWSKKEQHRIETAHISDVSRLFVSTAEKIGHPVCPYLGKLYFWNGSNWQSIDNEAFAPWLFSSWFRVCGLPIKQETKSFTDAIIDNLMLCGTELVFAIDTKKEDKKSFTIYTANAVLTIGKDGVSVSGHNRKNANLYSLDFEYIPNAECPMFDAYLESSLPDPTVRSVVLEFFAYCFMNGHRHQKLLMLTGEGANGKSVLMNIIRSFFPSDAVSNITTYAGFALETLLGKKLQISADMAIDGLKSGELETLKKLAAGDHIDVDRKFVGGGSTTLKNPPKIIISVNNPPKNIDTAFMRRLILIPFEQVFVESVNANPNKMIKDLDNAIIESECSGILNRVIEAAARLFSQDKFTKSAIIEGAIRELEKESNNAKLFASENLMPLDGYEINLDTLYNKYTEFCNSSGYHAQQKANFSKSITSYFKNKGVTRERKRDNEGKFFTIIKGIALFTDTHLDLSKIK